jgi:hypothetical protein
MNIENILKRYPPNVDCPRWIIFFHHKYSGMDDSSKKIFYEGIEKDLEISWYLFLIKKHLVELSYNFKLPNRLKNKLFGKLNVVETSNYVISKLSVSLDKNFIEKLFLSSAVHYEVLCFCNVSFQDCRLLLEKKMFSNT